MRKVILHVTDKQGLNLAEHSVAVALLTQSISQYVIFCVDFEPPFENLLVSSAQQIGKSVEYRPLATPQEFDELYRSKGAHSHVTSAASLKMNALLSLQGEFDRALYIDNDVLLMKDFGLDQINFGEAPIAAVYDIAKVGGIGSDADFQKRCKASGLSPHYFNSGVIAARLTALTSTHVELYQNALKHHSTCGYADDCSCDDQCAWNVAFATQWKRLPLTLNFQACAMFSDGWANAIARHYVGPQKFLPIRAWRNDRKDTTLIANARVLLGLSATQKQILDIVRRLNALRNLKMQKSANDAIAAINKMYEFIY